MTPQVATSEELLAPISPEIELCYQTFGDPQDEPLLLVMGLGGPMTWWDPELCAQLAREGFYVVRYDNRDVGRSSRATGHVRRRDLARAMFGRRARAPYSMADLAQDAFGLLDHTGIDSAHVVGVSMGGMIAQTMAIARPERVRSLTSIMSTTGRRSVGRSHPSLIPALLARRGQDRESYIEGSVAMWRLIGSPRFPAPEDRLRTRAGETYDRGVSRAGVLRQMMAIATQPDRTLALARISAPTLVMHGLADRLVHVSGGRATAAAVPGARATFVEGWGHDLPAALHPTFTTAIRRNADRAR
ncbi:alpha/beta fold hydrolase [Nocardioides albidus]|uniref:Alpha/beta fold hydrolase n=2 Tax=Nocardioides albidus TaxID=1517589 RepID=A0A5C4VLW7_9ACTN|nr:alpha/beta fold hydrolase [Nocardioides albidus]